MTAARDGLVYVAAGGPEEVAVRERVEAVATWVAEKAVRGAAVMVAAVRRTDGVSDDDDDGYDDDDDASNVGSRSWSNGGGCVARSEAALRRVRGQLRRRATELRERRAQVPASVAAVVAAIGWPSGR